MMTKKLILSLVGVIGLGWGGVPSQAQAFTEGGLGIERIELTCENGTDYVVYKKGSEFEYLVENKKGVSEALDVSQCVDYGDWGIDVCQLPGRFIVYSVNTDVAYSVRGEYSKWATGRNLLDRLGLRKQSQCRTYRTEF